MADKPFNSTEPTETEESAQAEAFKKPATPDLNPKSFTAADFAAWLAGVTPIRETVTIYADGNAQAEISRLALAEATAPEGEREKIAAELEARYADLIATGMEFVVEGRSSTWVGRFIDKTKEDGVTEPLEATLRQIAAQIVSPPGVTHEAIKALSDGGREADVNRLAEAVLKANEGALRIDPRFLPKASA